MKVDLYLSSGQIIRLNLERITTRASLSGPGLSSIEWTHSGYPKLQTIDPAAVIAVVVVENEEK